jgi:hypothetical protein
LSEVNVVGGNWANQKLARVGPIRIGEERGTARHVLVCNRARGEREHDGRSGNGARQLRDTVKDESHWANAASKEKSEADFRIEEPACRAEEEPSGYEQAEPKGRRDVERLLDGRPLYVMRCLHAAKRQEQEHGRPHKLEGGRLQVMRQARFGPESSEMRRSHRRRRKRRYKNKKKVASVAEERPRHPLYRVGPIASSSMCPPGPEAFVVGQNREPQSCLGVGNKMSGSRECRSPLREGGRSFWGLGAVGG